MTVLARSIVVLAAILGVCCVPTDLRSAQGAEPTAEDAPEDGGIVKAVLGDDLAGESLLRPGAWRPWRLGFETDNGLFVCDNGDDRSVQRGASQTVNLNQTEPTPIVAVAWSKADEVTGTPDSNYSLYLDLVYQDGTPLWGQVAPFATDTHPWQRRQVVIFPDKPVRSLSFHMLLRNHGGKAWFRDPELRVIHTPEGACLFDGVPVRLVETRAEGFQVRDVAAGSGFSQIDRRALGLELQWSETNWHRGGRWQPMSDADLLYRRALCKGKPYCFLMNTQFEQFSHELVERYMKRALAYGMFPGFFSHNASQGHYFTRPDLYNRDRLLFKKYVPLCRRLAEAGWEPMTLAESSDPHVHIERFGDRYLTVFNDSAEPRATAIQLHGLAPTTSRELLSSREVTWKRGATDWTIEPEDVAVIDLGP